MNSPPEMTAEHAVDQRTMRTAMGRFATGVAVVTTQDPDGAPHGMTVNSLTSVSLDPPVLLVCFNHGARTAEAVVESGSFAVSVLAERQESIAMRFASRGADHFCGLPLTFGEHGVPIVPDALAHLECSVRHHTDVGDHVVVFGTVRHACHREGQPLAFQSGRFAEMMDRGYAPPAWFF